MVGGVPERRAFCQMLTTGGGNPVRGNVLLEDLSLCIIPMTMTFDEYLEHAGRWEMDGFVDN